jgi:hypothetical protein
LLPKRCNFWRQISFSGDISLIVNEQNVREAINSFPAGSSPGLDGMRPQSLKDIISLLAGQQALRALTKLCNFLLSGQFVIYYMVRLYVPFIRKMEELDQSPSETVCKDCSQS